MVLVNGREIYFRTEGIRYAPPLDEFDQPQGKGDWEVYTRRLQVMRRTPKGVWVYDGLLLSPIAHEQLLAEKNWLRTSCRFINESANKRYAWPTELEAIESFVARKIREQRILESQLADSNLFMVTAQKELARIAPGKYANPDTGTYSTWLVEGKYRGPSNSMV